MPKIKPYDHRGMILHPEEWPAWPLLPLKRPVPGQTWPDMAFMIASTKCLSVKKGKPDPDKPFTILLGLMFQDHTKCKMKTYDNLQALLEAGWEVD